MTSPSLSAGAQSKHILFTRTLKIETGFDKRCITGYWTGFLPSADPPPPPFLVSSTHIYDSEMLYGQNILSVCPCKSICERVSPSLSAAFQQPTGKGPRLPEVYCVISRLGCFDLFSTVSSVCLMHANAPHFCFETVSYGILSADVLLNVCSQ